MTRSAGLAPEMTEMVVQTLRQVVARELPDAKILELDEKDVFPHELIETFLSPDVGLHLIFLPESAGGLGGGARDICRVSEEMARTDLGVATAFLAICLGTDPIIVGGTEEQKSTWLSRIAEGRIVAYGVTEPEAGSNVAALKTTADPITDEAGEVTGYRLNGKECGVEFHGDQGAMFIDRHGWTFHPKGDGGKLIDHQGTEEFVTLRHVKHFAECIRGQARPAVATSYAYVNPPVAVLLGVVRLGETVGPFDLAGMAIILVGVAVITLARHKKGAPPGSAPRVS